MQLDKVTNNLMTSIENPTLTSFSKVIDVLTEPNYLLPILLIASIYLLIKKEKRKSIVLATSTIATAISITLLKSLFQRPRPINGLIESTTFSLPSGHATTIVLFIGILIYLFSNKSTRKKSITIAIPIILLVSFTRLYLRVHYLTDVLAGLALGGIILGITIYLDKKL